MRYTFHLIHFMFCHRHNIFNVVLYIFFMCRRNRFLFLFSLRSHYQIVAIWLYEMFGWSFDLWREWKWYSLSMENVSDGRWTRAAFVLRAIFTVAWLIEIAWTTKGCLVVMIFFSLRSSLCLAQLLYFQVIIMAFAHAFLFTILQHKTTHRRS